ncbi:hypothetical protein QR680_000217 [Steinernema hermaphroditum]|uniref:UBA domain-containing protein n=1 Tax=Steinernema hermaphroditum TaxID=289476 RepID=A0AA39GTU4_9BILA|nr:hypothetical protein QR680_000217 [Steinernema hermaphroditum]
MLEGLVAWVLNTYIGEYLEDLNTDQLSIALLQGMSCIVELENVPLKKTALKKFDVPVQVKSGYLGKLTLSVPLTHMRSAPWVVKISDLLVLLGPSDGKYDVEFVERYEQTKKEQMLDELENFHKKQLLQALGIPILDESSQSQGSWWGASLVSTIVNNVQLILTNVHIRYEDDVSLPNHHPFNCGARIQKISVQTTDPQWKSGFVQPKEGENVFKILDLQGFSVYWNSGQPIHKEVASYKDLQKILAPEDTRNNNFVLQPFSASLKMEKNSSKLPLKATSPASPRFKFDFCLERVNIELSKRQFAEIRLLCREWARFDRARQHRKWRPLMSISEDGHSWWKFAYGRIAEPTRKQRSSQTWHFAYERAKQLNAYCRAYRKRLISIIEKEQAKQNPENGSSQNVPNINEDVVLMKQIERDSQYTYQELNLFRETVFRRLMKEREDAEEEDTSTEYGNQETHDAVDSIDAPRPPTPQSPKSGGSGRSTPIRSPNQAQSQQTWYGWMSSWFSSETPSEDNRPEVEQAESLLLDVLPDVKERPLPPYLQRLEKQLEDEIMDVLTESWDDSNVLRRDALLAEIMLHLEKMTIRFVDFDEEVRCGDVLPVDDYYLKHAFGRTRVLAMDLWNVVGRLHLSPRHNSTTVTLSVGDMGIQRLQTESTIEANEKENGSADESVDKLEDADELFQDTSLIYGTTASHFVHETSKLLLAIGKSSDGTGEDGESDFEIEGQQFLPAKPIFQMVYRRRAPKLIARHTLEATFSSMSVMYDEDALEGLASLFDMESAFVDANNDGSTSETAEFEQQSHLFFTIKVPEVQVELRSRRSTLLGENNNEDGIAFSNLKIADVRMEVVRTEQFVTRANIAFGEIVLLDMFESPNQAILRAVTPKLNQSLSMSCPDLFKSEQTTAALSSSLPSKWAVFGPPKSAEKNKTAIRKASTFADEGYGLVTIDDRSLIRIKFVDSHHPAFEQQFEKTSVFVNVTVANVDLGVNRRTWVMLMDFFGLLGQPEAQKSTVTSARQSYSTKMNIMQTKATGEGVESQAHQTNTAEAYTLSCSFEIEKLALDMNYPANKTQLGRLSLTDAAVNVKLHLGDSSKPMQLDLTTTAVCLSDRTPFYSQLYDERLTITANDGATDRPTATIQLIKYMEPDPLLKRQFDMSLKMMIPSSMNTFYVHTHRYLTSVADFWCQLAELQQQVSNDRRSVVQSYDQHKSRCLMDICIDGNVNVAFPLNQFSRHVVLLETQAIAVSNDFVCASKIHNFKEYCLENPCPESDDYDCVIDAIEAHCKNASFFEAFCRSHDVSSPQFHHDDIPKFGDIYTNAPSTFQKFDFVKVNENLLNKPKTLKFIVYRNIDEFISHNAPNNAVILSIDDAELNVSTEFYRLIRGVLEKNFADPLIPVPETIPIEILQKPESTVETLSPIRYITFAFRLSFCNVVWNCRTLSPLTREGRTFAQLDLQKARISFDGFTDNQSEFNMTCDSAELIDCNNDCYVKNVFTTVLQPCWKGRGASALNLMFEADILMKKDEAPKVSIVLMNSRILLFPKFLNDALNYFLLNTDFIPPEEESHMHAPLCEIAKDGVIVRSHGVCVAPETLSDNRLLLKLNMKECDLVLIENPTSSNSLAIIAATTAVVNMTDIGGEISAVLEIQQLNVSWCLMSAPSETSCRLTNDFTATIQLGLERNEKTLTECAKAFVAGLPSITNPKHHLILQLNHVVGRMSYKDAMIVRSIVTKAMQHYQKTMESPPLITQGNASPSKQPAINIQRVALKANQLSMWLLDDYKGTSLPLARFIVSSICANYGSCSWTSSFNVGVDYFNQKLFEWKPLLEQWVIQKFVGTIKEKLCSVELQTRHLSTLDINLTQAFVQQFLHQSSRWDDIRRSVDSDMHGEAVMQSRSDHLPYLLRNDTGSEIVFTTGVDEILKARAQQRKPNVKWVTVPVGKTSTFEFPIKRLLQSDDSTGSGTRQIAVQVDGYSQVSPLNVDSVGCYYRNCHRAAHTQSGSSVITHTCLVAVVSMEKDGRKVVTLRSPLVVVNKLSQAAVLSIETKSSTSKGAISFLVDPGQQFAVPLKYSTSKLEFRPGGQWSTCTPKTVDWRTFSKSGAVKNVLVKFHAEKVGNYWMCISVKREHPETEYIPGHLITLVPPLTIMNLLPIDIEITTATGKRFPISAGKKFAATCINIDENTTVRVQTDRFYTPNSASICRSVLSDGSTMRRLDMPMSDSNGRPLDMYGNLTLGKGGCLELSLWVPYWVVNKSGIPLIIKQESASTDAAGQFEEHERAKDRHPLMFSLSDDRKSGKYCSLRVGNRYINDPGYSPRYSDRFALSPGVQALKLLVSHEQEATLIYNVGVDVRQGQGRYKDTQVVLLTPRYHLDNQSSSRLFLAHYEFVDRPHKHVSIDSKCNMIWNENFEDKRMLCVRMDGVKHWSCPFRIDQIGSFHVTMRDASDTPNFVRVEVSLNSAVFCVTFADACYFPPPIRIVNQSNVPVLYQQFSEKPREAHLRTICKARSTVDYAWDDLYAAKRVTLQVFENRSHSYDPNKPGNGPQLVYENNVFIRYLPSFTQRSPSGFTDDQELVLEVLQNGKVILNKMSISGGNSQNQLWKLASDGCLENIGMNQRSRSGERYVLDVLDRAEKALMMMKRNSARNKFQFWRLTSDQRLACGIENAYAEVRDKSSLFLSVGNTSKRECNDRGIPVAQLMGIQRQKPGSGVLNVECLHKGPTLVVRIVDQEEVVTAFAPKKTSVVTKSTESSSFTDGLSYEISVSMPSGVGFSLINGRDEELLYARFHGVSFHTRVSENNYRLTASVNVIQIDNQLTTSDKWQFVFCHMDALNDEADTPTYGENTERIDEWSNCAKCFRVKVSDMCVQLDEMLLWKLIEFIQESGATDSFQPDTLLQPPNMELERPDPLKARKCYFGTLDLEMGCAALSVVTIATSGLPPELRALKQQFNIKLVSFENASITMPPFRQLHYFETFSFLGETLRKFYMSELQKQTVNIVITMDAFGNPLGLATDIKESFQCLFLEGDVGGFVSGVGYGVTNSISKVASSFAHGVGSITYDEQHELMRQRMLRSSSQQDYNAALSHLYGGVKGLGVGLLGGFTAIFNNPYTGAKRGGLTGGIVGGLTGAVDAVTKPVQGVFDFVEGTASAMKEMIGSPSSRKSRFAEERVRAPRLPKGLGAANSSVKHIV